MFHEIKKKYISFCIQWRNNCFYIKPTSGQRVCTNSFASLFSFIYNQYVIHKPDIPGLFGFDLLLSYFAFTHWISVAPWNFKLWEPRAMDGSLWTRVQGCRWERTTFKDISGKRPVHRVIQQCHEQRLQTGSQWVCGPHKRRVHKHKEPIQGTRMFPIHLCF